METLIPESFVRTYSPLTVSIYHNSLNYKWEDIKVGDVVLTTRNGYGSMGPVIRTVSKVEEDKLYLIEPGEDPENARHNYLVYKFMPASVRHTNKDEHFWENILPLTLEEYPLPWRGKKKMIFDKTGWCD